MWESPALIEQIREGTAQAEADMTVDLGSFARFLDEVDDDKALDKAVDGSGVSVIAASAITPHP